MPVAGVKLATSRGGTEPPLVTGMLMTRVEKAGVSGHGVAALGRDRELGLIGSFLEQAATEGGALLLTGDPGVGKTMLLDAAAAAAGAAGTRVLCVAGTEFGGGELLRTEQTPRARSR